MDATTTTGSVPQPGASGGGVSRRGFLRGLAAGSAAVAGVPLVAAVGGTGGMRAAAKALQGEAVDVTLITTIDLPYPGIPSADEQAADPGKKAYAEAVQPWLDQNPGVKLKEITFDVYTQETLVVAISGGTAPSFYPADVLFDWNEEKVLAQEKSGLAADVTAQVAQYDLEAKLADYCLAVWKTKALDGKHYALPYSYNCGDGIHYRKDHLQEVGLAEPAAGWTWQNLRELAKALTNENRKGITLQDWGFSWFWAGEGFELLTKLPAPETSWNWKWDYSWSGVDWAGLIAWARDMVNTDQSVLHDIAMKDDEIVSQFLEGNASMMNNNVGYFSRPPSNLDSPAAVADQAGKAVGDIFGFIAHPVGVNGYNQTTWGQLDTMAFNPDLDATALDKATSLHVYMMGPGMVLQKQAAFAASNDLRYVWAPEIILPLYKPSEVQGIPGSPEEAWGEAFMANVRAAAAIPLQPAAHWFIPPSAEAGPPETPYEDMRSKWFFEGGDQDVKADLEQLQNTQNTQAADFTAEVSDDQFVSGAKAYYAALDAYFEQNAPAFYGNVYKPWQEQFVTPVLG